MEASQEGRGTESTSVPLAMSTVQGELTVCKVIINYLMKQTESSLPFRQPVDHIALKIPKYPEIISHPMDLSTIWCKIDNGFYKDIWDFIHDVELIFDNAHHFNAKSSKVAQHARILQDQFHHILEFIMPKLGYCCTKRRIFTPQKLICNGKENCMINVKAKFYSHEKYLLCDPCFNTTQDDSVTINNVAVEERTCITLSKSNFTSQMNDRNEFEKFVVCTLCGRRYHQVCEMHLNEIWPEGFACGRCTHGKRRPEGSNKFTAQALRRTALGDYMENHVNNFINENGGEVGVVVRVLGIFQKSVKVKPMMKQKFPQFAEEFPYRFKVIYVFQEIDRVDVCLFGMLVQEYGSECPEPNRKHVYIAYLDSVRYFQPSRLRRQFHHEIILAYLQFVKDLQFEIAHIWAAPPQMDDDDYMFNRHPPEMVYPTRKKLQEWYIEMFRKGMDRNLILEFKNILNDSADKLLLSTVEIPYFEGDFWPGVIEELIKEVEKEETKQAKRKTSPKSKKSKRKPKLSEKIIMENSSMDPLTQNIYTTMETHKEEFFIVHLKNSDPSMITTDPDSLIPCHLMDGRDGFLALCRDNRFEFCTLRHAKFATMVMLLEVHMSTGDWKCSHCKSFAEWRERWICRQPACAGLTICSECKNRSRHPHKLTKECNLTTRRPVKDTCESAISRLEHSSNCRETFCTFNGCEQTRNILNHTRQSATLTVKKTENGNNSKLHVSCSRSECNACQTLLILCSLHAKKCERKPCPVIFCDEIRDIKKGFPVHSGENETNSRTRQQKRVFQNHEIDYMKLLDYFSNTFNSEEQLPISKEASSTLAIKRPRFL